MQTSISSISLWPVYKQRPLLIAGPCSAETEQQVLQTARALKENGRTDVFRAGLWKPRTRPGGYEGPGARGLKWLKRVKEETGLPVATEVAQAKHVYEALKYEVDFLWIGARSTANPFVVQEIADALEGSGACVLIKNPVNPDLNLWLGAIERIQRAGIRHLAAVHRGFSAWGKTRFRNMPYWVLPLELKQRLPNLPLLCDPSHICGNRTLLLEVSQKAMDLCFDGLMIESHCQPSRAWSDPAQQLTPKSLETLMGKLIIREARGQVNGNTDTLDNLRRKIDIFDEQLMELLEQRMSASRDIARVKKDGNITILQSGRWADIMKKNLKKARGGKLSRDFVAQVFQHIHQESINHQNLIMNELEDRGQ